MAGMNTLSGVFFDLDDTLYDHLTPLRNTLQSQLNLPDTFNYEAAYQRFRYYSDHLAAIQKDAFAAHNVEGQHRMRTERYIRMLKEFDISITMQVAERLQQDYLSRQYDIALFEGAKETIQQLNEKGCLVGIITNGAEAHQQNKIQALALEELISTELIFITGRVGWDKPDPRIFHHVLSETKILAENAVYIGDSWRNDVIGALEAGMTMIWFNHRHADRESSHLPHAEVRSYADIQSELLAEPIYR